MLKTLNKVNCILVFFLSIELLLDKRIQFVPYIYLYTYSTLYKYHISICVKCEKFFLIMNDKLNQKKCRTANDK